MGPLRCSHRKTLRLHRVPASSVGRLATDVATGNFAYAQAMCRVGGGSRARPWSYRFGTKEMEEKNDQAARAISTGQLNALQRLHLRPINLVIYEGPSGGLRPGRSHLQASFPLRCFQRLSLPHIATRRCDWRHNRYTRDTSTPVLSY